MAHRNQPVLDYEPVTKRGGAASRASKEEFAEPSPFEFPEPFVAPDDEPGAAFTRQGQKESPPPGPETPGLKHESWIVKRGHTFSYLGLFLFTLVLYFRPYELIPALAAFSSMALVLALLTLAIYVPSQVALEGNLTARPREVNLLLLLVVAALLSIPFAISPGEAWETFNDTFLKAVLMFIVMVNVVRTESRLKGLLWAGLAVSCMLSLNALDNYWAGNFTVEGYRVEGDIGGMFSNPNDMALHLVTMTPIAVALMLTARSIPVKLLYGACAALMIAGNVVTFSRGGFIGLVASMAVIAWKTGRKNRLAVIMATVVAFSVFVALAPGGYGLRILSLFDSNLDPVGSSSMRRELLIRSIIVALRNPLVGIGMGNFHIVSIREHVSHNAYTQVAAELGMAATVLYTLFIVTPLKRLRQIERESFNDRRRSRFHYLAIGLQASLVAYMTSSFFASVAYQWYVYYLVAYAICLRRIYDIEHGTVKDENEAKREENQTSISPRGGRRASVSSNGIVNKNEQVAG